MASDNYSLDTGDFQKQKKPRADGWKKALDSDQEEDLEKPKKNKPKKPRAKKQ